MPFFDFSDVFAGMCLSTFIMNYYVGLYVLSAYFEENKHGLYVISAYFEENKHGTYIDLQ